MAAYCRVDDLQSSVGWLPEHRDQLWAQRSVTSMGSLYLVSYAQGSCHLTNSIRTLKEAQNTDPNQCPGLNSLFFQHRTPDGSGIGSYMPLSGASNLLVMVVYVDLIILRVLFPIWQFTRHLEDHFLPVTDCTDEQTHKNQQK